jgi:uncharacterized protein (TIGR03086 family)
MTTTPNDPRPQLDTALALAADTVAAVRADQLELPTPCTDFTVRQLAAHLVDVALRIGDLGRGVPVFNGFEPVRGPSIDQVTGDDWSAALKSAAVDAAAGWDDDATLDRVIELPWATLPGRDQLAGYLNELSVHTWDLATATGQSPMFDDSVLAAGLTAMQGMLPPTGRDFAPFDDAVEVADDAPLIDRLVAYNGRRPR